MDGKEIVARETTEMNAPLTALAIRAQVQLIQEVMAGVMQGPSKENPNGVHYGLIPGCGDKPTLLKPGAEKLFLTFRLRPIINPNSDVIITELPNGHRDYRVHCHILNMGGTEMATGVGSASTMETKHRYRGGEKKSTGKPVPKEYWNLNKEGKIKEALTLIGGSGFGPGKIDGQWMICEKGEKMENPDIADQYNTVLKMACKRAKVDGCLSATACSDIFTQDIEDFSTETGEPLKAHIQSTNTAPDKDTEALEAQRKAKAEEYTRNNPKPAPAKPLAPSKDVKTATGLITHTSEPNKGGFVNITIEGYQKENGKDMQFSTRDTAIIETIVERMNKGEKISIEYTPNENPNFASSIVQLVSVQEKERAEVGD